MKKIEELLEKKLFNINESLDDVLIEIVDYDFKTNNFMLEYLLDSIEYLSKRIKEKIKE